MYSVRKTDHRIWPKSMMTLMVRWPLTSMRNWRVKNLSPNSNSTMSWMAQVGSIYIQFLCELILFCCHRLEPKLNANIGFTYIFVLGSNCRNLSLLLGQMKLVFWLFSMCICRTIDVFAQFHCKLISLLMQCFQILMFNSFRRMVSQSQFWSEKRLDWD